MQKVSRFYILGDFNMPFINWQSFSSSTTSGEIFIDFCIQHSLEQHINKATHKYGSILDLILCDKASFTNLESINILSPLSTTCDHNIITFSLYYETSSSQKQPLPYLCYNRGDYDQINQKLSIIPFEEIISRLNYNVQDIYDYFINEMNTLVQQHVPLSKYRPTIKQPKSISNLAKKKKSLYCKLKLNPSL